MLSGVDEDREPELVMAIPRRELYGVQGVRTDFDLSLITCLAEESWFGLPAAHRADVDVKEVRLGVILRRDDQILVDEDGTAVFVVPVPAEATRLGHGLKALKELARLAGESLLDRSCPGVKLIAYHNDDRDEELRRCVILLYEVNAGSGAEAPAGYAWVSLPHLTGMPLEPLSTETVSTLYT